MLQRLSSSILLLCGAFYPSFFSAVYVFSGTLIWFATLFAKQIPESLLRAALIFGLISLAAKITVLLMLNYSALMIFGFSPDSTIMQGLFFNEGNSFVFYFKNFAFDIIAIICLVLSLIGKRKLKHKQYFKFRIEIMWIGLFILAIYASSYVTWANFIYSLTSLVYAANLRYKSMKLNLLIFRFISIAATVQIVTSYILALIFEDPSLSKSFWIYGFILNDLNILGMFLMAFLVHLIFTFFSIAYKQEKHFGETTSDMQIPLISKEYETEPSLQESFDKPSLKYFLNNSPKELLFHTLARLMLIVWVIYFRNILSIFLMIPLFYTIISTSKRKTLFIYRFIVIPLQSVGFGISYGIKLYNDAHSYKDLAAISYLFVTTIWFLILVRLPYVKTEEKYTRKLRTLFSYWHWISLFGIMSAALSEINYILGIIIIFYFIFLIVPPLIEKYWKWLVLYSMAALLISKIFNVFPSLASFLLLDNYKIGSLGISLDDNEKVIYLNEVILWTVVILSGIQLWVNKASHQLHSESLKIEEEQEDRKLIKAWKKILYKAIHWIKRGEIWLSILLIFTFILFSAENLINFGRFILAGVLLILLRKPIKKPDNRNADQEDHEAGDKEENKEEENQPESINNPLLGLLTNKFTVKTITNASVTNSPLQGQETKENFMWYDYTALWVITYIFMCLSAVILIGEYFYQFWPYLPFPTLDISLIGFSIYSRKDLYSTLLLDSCLFISSKYTYHLIIRQQESSKMTISELIKTYQFRAFCECFNFALLFTIFYLSCYWKLSFSMLLYLIVIIIYFIAISIYLNSKNKTGYRKEWNYRLNMWKVLFTITILALIFSYTDIMMQPLYESQSYEYTEWIFYFSGFSASKKWSIFDNYGYVVICIMLIIERHCLEYLKPNYDATYLTGLLKSDKVKISKKVNVIVVRILTWLRTISEAIIPMILLFTAFQKLTVIGFVYLLTALFVPLANKRNQKVIICIVVAIMVILQYSLILSNINGKNSPQKSPARDPFENPWYARIDWPTKDDAYFLSLGTEISQLHSLLYDEIILLLCLFHFIVLSNERDKLKKLEKEKGEFAEAKNEEKETEKLKIFMDTLKKNTLRFSRLLLLFLVLLFLTNSFGLISLVYIIFSLLLIIKETTLVKSNLGSYTRLLSHLLIYTLLDLIIQFVFQIPFKVFDSYKDSSLFKVIGVKRLWSAGTDEENSEDYSSSQLEIDMKILIFTLMYVIYRMINSQEFLVYFDSLTKEILRESIGIGIEKARLFNDGLIEKNIKYEQRRAIFVEKLERLETQLNLIRKNAPITFTYQKSENESYEIEKEGQMKKIKNIFDRILISMVDTAMFRKFISTIIERNSKIQNINIELEDLGSQPQKIFRRASVSNKQSKEDNELNLEDESSAVEVYNLTLSDYIKLLLLYIPASNTQNIVFFMCFLNNFIYASLESVILPISIVGYAMFENPRPPSNYFWLLLYYISTVVFVKFCFQLDLWPYLTNDVFPINYHDPAKIGFNLAQNTYSGAFFWYIFYDALLIVTILFHTYYLRRVGLHNRVEYEIESFEQAKVRYIKQVSSADESLELKSHYPYQIDSGSFFGKFVKLISRIIPKNKEEKPGKDLYLPLILIQLIILVYIFICFTRMEGYSHDISQSIKANQFQGRMVIALMLQFFLILIERYLYVRKTSQALKDDQVASLERKDTLLNAKRGQRRASTKKMTFLPAASTEKIEFDKELIHRQFTEAENCKNIKVTWVEGDHEIVQWKVVFNVEAIENSKDKKIEATIIFPFQYPKYPPKMICKKNIHHKIIDNYEKSIIPEFINGDWKGDHAIYNILNQILIEFNYEAPHLEKSSEKRWNKAMIVRLLSNILIMAAIHALVFWYFPIDGNRSLSGKPYCTSFDNRDCNDFQINVYIEWFYILFAIYFVIMSLQIRHGLPSFRKVSFPFMRSTSMTSYRLFKAYLALPFLYELRTLLDWTFTPTALDLFQWFKFEDINARLYQTRCIQLSYSYHKKGENISAWQKGYMGFFTLFLICFVILIPLIIFSSLNPIMEKNDVKWMDMKIKIICQSRSYSLYDTKSHDEMHFITDEEWNAKNMNEVKDIQSSDKPHLQVISLPRFQETYWGITPPSRDRLCYTLNNTANYQESKLLMVYTFWRTYPTTQPGVSETLFIPLGNSTNTFYQMICEGKYDMIYSKTHFYGSFVKLPSAGATITPYTVIDEKFSPNLYMKIHKDERNSSYWEVGILTGQRRPKGPVFYVISDSYSPVTFGFSLWAFYISIVYLIARFLRYFVTGGSQNIYMTDMKNPVPLITLCSGIYVCRMRGQLIKEEELYYELIDILRSTEQVKSMTGTSSIKEKMD
ncbi:unnamed protein product [Blepharisma stoltei]|uniref:Piezo non-specific cation channel R-Ras-binding domain-containing protein n=1 Tax=Blepharisma stoltei TaxID=1481888 RepID=A0AAU9JCD8_9CILI|nr:unnamed protein product [Blepharisma stoltei]